MSSLNARSETASGPLLRGQWQAQVGSELFGDYYELLTQQTPPDAYAVRYEGSTPDSALINLGRASAQRMVNQSRGTPAEELLYAERHELFAYTDLEEMRYASDTVKDAIARHSTDGMEFAHAMTMGVVVEAISAARHRVDIEGALECAGNVLANPDSEAIIRNLATTGFATIGSDHAPRPGSIDTTHLNQLTTALGVPYTNDVLRLSGKIDSPGDFRSIGMHLRPDITGAFRARLREQNKEVQTGNINTFHAIKMDHMGKPGFSSGCPVAHNDRTFGQMRQYLGEVARLTADSLYPAQ